MEEDLIRGEFSRIVFQRTRILSEFEIATMYAIVIKVIRKYINALFEMSRIVEKWKATSSNFSSLRISIDVKGFSFKRSKKFSTGFRMAKLEN